MKRYFTRKVIYWVIALFIGIPLILFVLFSYLILPHIAGPNNGCCPVSRIHPGYPKPIPGVLTIIFKDDVDDSAALSILQGYGFSVKDIRFDPSTFWGSTFNRGTGGYTHKYKYYFSIHSNDYVHSLQVLNDSRLFTNIEFANYKEPGHTLIQPYDFTAQSSSTSTKDKINVFLNEHPEIFIRPVDPPLIKSNPTISKVMITVNIPVGTEEKWIDLFKKNINVESVAKPQDFGPI